MTALRRAAVPPHLPPLLPTLLLASLVVAPLPALAGPLAVASAALDEPPADEATADDEADAAEDAPATLLSDEIVVSAERRPLPEHEIGSSVTVIDREEIERRHEDSVLELLRTVPGVSVVHGGGAGRVATVFVRGASSEQTLVLVDGLRVNPASGGGVDFADVSTLGVERIEVLRGPQSTLYGSEAMGGVVSITTRRGVDAGDRLAADLSLGSLDTERLALSAAGERGAFDYSLGFAELRTDGVSVASELRGNDEVDPYERTTAFGRLGWRFAPAARADLTVRWSDATTALDGFAFGVGPVDDPNFLQDHRREQVALVVGGELRPGWRTALRLGSHREETEGTDPDSPFNAYAFDSRLDTAAVETGVDLGRLGHTTAGYDFERRRAANRGAYDETAELHSLFLLHRWSWSDRLHLSAGVRHDDYSQSAGDTTWRVTGSWVHPRLDGRLHGSWGTGFRVPSFTELFFPGAGNPSLAPEASRGWDLGWEQGFLDGRVALDVTAFGNRFRDLIAFDLATFTFGNVARAETEGVETRLVVRPAEPLELVAGWTWTDSDDGAGRPLARRPEHRGTLSLAWTGASGWRGTLGLVAVADRVESDGRPMDDYERVDLAVDAPAWGRLRPYGRIDNLLDQDYEELPGFTTPGLTGRVGLRATW